MQDLESGQVIRSRWNAVKSTRYLKKVNFGFLFFEADLNIHKDFLFGIAKKVFDLKLNRFHSIAAIQGGFFSLL